MANLIVNPRRRIIHDERLSEERCNVDDLRRRGEVWAVDDDDYARLIAKGYRLCHWCEARRRRFGVTEP